MKKKCTLYRIIIAIMVIMLLPFGFSVQAQQVMQINEAIEQMLSSNDPAIVEQGLYLQSLISDVQPSVYLTKGQMAAFGTENPKVVYSDILSLNMLYESHPLYSQAELLKLTINSAGELPATINLEQIQGFPELKYLYIVFSYDACGDENDNCLISILEKVIQGANVPILCKLSILE